MKRKSVQIITLALLAALSLAACKPDDDKETTVSFESKVNETQEETTEAEVETTEAEIPETTEAEKETSAQKEDTKKEPPVLMASGDKKLTADELKKYAEYFDEYGTWYTQALTSFYDSAKMVDLKELFYNGVELDGEDDLTDAEKAYLKENATSFYEEGLDTVRVNVAEMDQVLQQYFGIKYENTAKVGTDRMNYWKETDSFYICSGDTNATKMVPYAGVQRSNGNIVLFYEHEWSYNGYCMITVKPVDDGLQIVSHQKISTSK
ncbi:MAG: hypothetical protein J6I64_08450 [Lachnospiraceae bacterium]|nr:hypothetical protein [Lachnospiraceae bacterium]